MSCYLPTNTSFARGLVLCAALLPFSALHAASPASKTFGGFKPSQKFTLTVQEVTSTQAVGTKVKNGAKIPEGIPSFKKGQKITVKIESKGEWTGPGFSIPLLNSSTAVNSYAKQPTSKTVSPVVATVIKSSSGKPAGGSMVFYQYRISEYSLSNLTINRVGYILK
ncbi:MAG: hypothetical protein EOP84_09000 [Verrucomicrobiaceae bacterium]|nr:MAG: hypothetical protein EOP84_09000 [Verrucomicrobiaceae bacterium]